MKRALKKRSIGGPGGTEGLQRSFSLQDLQKLRSKADFATALQGLANSFGVRGATLRLKTGGGERSPTFISVSDLANGCVAGRMRMRAEAR